MTDVEVVAPGALTTIQDLGRPGWAHIGVPRSGAGDRESLKLANLLVGNDAGAAALETTLAGPRLRFRGESVVALTGAAVSARMGADQVPMNRGFSVTAGDELRLGTARQGLRTYIAFAGGLDVPLVLGSAATDVLTGLGPAPLAAGDILRLGERGGRTARPPAPEPPPPLELPDSVVLQVVVGPRSDWVTSDSIKRLLTQEYEVSHASNRIGLRLHGPPLTRARTDTLLSEGLVPGAVQVPPDGQPILLLADHPTTGGYPVVAVVVSEDLRLAAQLRPGLRLRFAGASPDGGDRSQKG